jgi:hypothetical protein
MEQLSRRAFVGGAAGTAAIAGALALAEREPQLPQKQGITVLPGGSSAPVPTPAVVEEGHLQALVGQPIGLADAEHALEAVVHQVRPARISGKLPAGVRQDPFYVYFAMPKAGAPAGNRIYRLSRPIAGLTDVFLTRGMDVGGKAMLVAQFA